MGSQPKHPHFLIAGYLHAIMMTIFRRIRNRSRVAIIGTNQSRVFSPSYLVVISEKPSQSRVFPAALRESSSTKLYHTRMLFVLLRNGARKGDPTRGSVPFGMIDHFPKGGPAARHCLCATCRTEYAVRASCTVSRPWRKSTVVLTN